MSEKEIIPMIGMSIEDWRDHLSSVMHHQETEAALRKGVIEELINLSSQDASSPECDRLIDFLINYTLSSDRYSHAMRMLLQYLPKLFVGGLGVQGHLLASIRREFQAEHDLIFTALSKIYKNKKNNGSVHHE
jgi:hypothetical protein